MNYIVLHKRGSVGSFTYKVKSEMESKTLFGALNCLSSDGFQAVYLSNPSAYGEYSPFKEVFKLSDLFIIAGNMANGTLLPPSNQSEI